MERITRERSPVGRKLWRRRRKKRTAPAAPPPAQPRVDPVVFDEPTPEPHIEVRPERGREGGMWAMLRGLFSRGPRTPTEETASVAPGDDPVRRILALPKGPARLDAFAETLAELTPGSHAQRAVALAFHRELTTMAEKAQVDLALLPERVEACAEALVAAGEVERAGQLLARIGRRQRAAELFVAAGAIDDLDELHLHIDLEEGGPKFKAKLSYERFEALFLVGRRAEALDALRSAARLWPENPVYGEILRTFESRLLPARRASFTAGTSHLLVVREWPVVIGRGEDAALRLRSPLVSRAHVHIAHEGDRLVAYDLDTRGGTRVDGEPVLGSRALSERGTIDMVGVTVRYERRPDALWLWADLTPQQKTIAAFSDEVSLPDPAGRPGFRLSFDREGRAIASAQQGVSVDGEALQRPVLLLAGDKIAGPGFLWHASSR